MSFLEALHETREQRQAPPPEWVNWFSLVWPDETERHAVLGEYMALKNSQRLLLDICIRGAVFRPFEPGVDPRVAEGRRQLALEILRLAEIDPAIIMRLAFKPQTKGEAP